MREQSNSLRVDLQSVFIARASIVFGRLFCSSVDSFEFDFKPKLDIKLY